MIEGLDLKTPLSWMGLDVLF